MTEYEKEKFRGLVSGMSDLEKTIMIEALLQDKGMCIIALDIINKTLVITEEENDNTELEGGVEEELE